MPPQGDFFTKGKKKQEVTKPALEVTKPALRLEETLCPADQRKWREAMGLLKELQAQWALGGALIPHGIGTDALIGAEVGARVGDLLVQFAKRVKCEDCRLRQPTWAVPADGAGCAPGATPVPVVGKPRWCARCAKAHPGAADVHSRKCEDCKLKQPTFKLPADKKKRWCADCARVHASAILDRAMCESCAGKRPNFGMQAEGNARWCAECSMEQPGAVNLASGQPAAREGMTDAILAELAEGEYVIK